MLDNAVQLAALRARLEELYRAVADTALQFERRKAAAEPLSPRARLANANECAKPPL